MRCSAWSSLAISACSSLAFVLAGPARAHIDATPAFLQAGGTETISLTAHNDREVAMEAFAVTASPGVGVADADGLEGWTASVDGTTARWTGGSVAAGDTETFSVVVEASGEPGAVFLQAEQQYPDDRIVSSPVSLTVVPADESSSGRYVWAIALAAALVLAAVAGLAWRRRRA